MISSRENLRIFNTRRSFLLGILGIITSLATASCSNDRQKLKILLLEDSVPLQSINDFRKNLSTKISLDFEPSSQISNIYSSLKNWYSLKNINNDNNIDNNQGLLFGERDIDAANLITLGDFWLEVAIQQNMLQPLNSDGLEGWSKLPQPWQQLVRRNSRGKLDPNGRFWGAPYRWGSVVIAYRKDKLQKLGWTPTDWEDLWREEIGDRVSLLDSPRETIGLTLKKLGYSYNTEDLGQVPNLESELLALHRQAKLYSSDTYLQPLILGDTWLAVAWSADILAIAKRYSNIGFVIPQSGTSLWSDLWVKPKLPENLAPESEELTAAIAEWIGFCWQPKTARQISLFTNGTSPVLVGTELQDLPKSLQDNPFLNPEVLNLDNSEFLLPISSSTQQQYRDLWLKIRQQVPDSV